MLYFKSVDTFKRINSSTVREVGTHNYQRDGVKRKSQGVIHRIVPGWNYYPQDMRSHDNLVRRFFLTW